MPGCREGERTVGARGERAGDLGAPGERGSRMTGSELRVAREFLGLDRADLARIVEVREDTVRRWEIGKDPVTFRVRDAVVALEELTASAVKELVATLRTEGDPRAVVFREQEGLAAEYPEFARLGVRWWRHVVARAIAEVPGARVGTREELDTIDAELNH